MGAISLVIFVLLFTLGVTKYEPSIPACLSGRAKGTFPSFIEKTDETRVQVLQDRLTKFKGVKCVYSEKLDGASATYYFNNGEFGVCSRSLNLIKDDRNTYWQMVEKYNIENKLRNLGRNIAIQGELIGDGIQSNEDKLGKTKEDCICSIYSTLINLSILDMRSSFQLLNN